jgi:hypothetical protein
MSLRNCLSRMSHRSPFLAYLATLVRLVRGVVRASSFDAPSVIL